ncbi:ribonuclease H-like domain-containing protein [Tanacetum coccineum]
MILSSCHLKKNCCTIRETKARNYLLQSLPEDHMADFHHLDDAKDIWLAVKARFGGNEESKKMRKSMLKQEFADFKISESEGLHKGYDRFQKVLSQLNQMQARPDNEDCNMKFLRALPPSWSQVAITLKTKGGLDFLSFDDLYNKLRTLEIDVKGGSSYDSRVPAAPTHSAFISAASTNSKWSTADSKCQPSSVSYTTTSSSADASGNVLENILHSFVAESDPQQQIMKTLTKLASWIWKNLTSNGRWQCFLFESIDLKRRLVENSSLITKMLPGKKVDSKTRYSQFKIKELDKSEEPKALVLVDSMLNWSDHESDDMEKGAFEVYGMIAGYRDDAVIPAVDAADGVSIDGSFADGVFVAAGNSSDGVFVAAGVGVDGVFVTSSDATDAETHFALMGLSPQRTFYDGFVKAGGLHAVPGPITGTSMPPFISLTFDKSSDSETTDFASCVSSVQTSSSKTNEPLAFYCDFYENQLRLNNAPVWKNVENIPSFIPRPAYVPAGSRNRPTSVPAGRPFPAGWHNPAARPMTRPKSHYFQQFRRPESYKPNGYDGGEMGNAVKTSENKVLFTDKECLVLSKEFQLPDSSQVVSVDYTPNHEKKQPLASLLARRSKEKVMFIDLVPWRTQFTTAFNLTDIHSEREIKCLLAKASLDESTKWHRRMAHVNFKNMNKLAKHGLVNGLPSKLIPQ